MIDIEDELFNIVSKKVKTKFKKLNMTSEVVQRPASFPSASMVCVDSSVYRDSQSSSSFENHAVVLYEVNVYSNKNTGKKTECKNIINAIDAEMQSLGFTRRSLGPVPNFADSTIYRMVARYSAIVSKDNVIYRR